MFRTRKLGHTHGSVESPRKGKLRLASLSLFAAPSTRRADQPTKRTRKNALLFGESVERGGSLLGAATQSSVHLLLVEITHTDDPPRPKPHQNQTNATHHPPPFLPHAPPPLPAVPRREPTKATATAMYLRRRVFFFGSSHQQPMSAIEGHRCRRRRNTAPPSSSYSSHLKARAAHARTPHGTRAERVSRRPALLAVAELVVALAARVLPRPVPKKRARGGRGWAAGRREGGREGRRTGGWGRRRR